MQMRIQLFPNLQRDPSALPGWKEKLDSSRNRGRSRYRNRGSKPENIRGDIDSDPDSDSDTDPDEASPLLIPLRVAGRRP